MTDSEALAELRNELRYYCKKWPSHTETFLRAGKIKLLLDALDAGDAEREGLERRIRAALGSHSDSAQWWESWAQQSIRWLDSCRERAAQSSDPADA